MPPPPPVITYPGILTSRTFDRTADCLDENFVISVARIRLCNGANLRYYKIEMAGERVCFGKKIVGFFSLEREEEEEGRDYS